jgi:hypothetical protein
MIMTRIAVVIALVLGAPVRPMAQSDSDIAKQFVGIWRLSSWVQRLSDGTTRQSPLSMGQHRCRSCVLCGHGPQSTGMEIGDYAD